MVEVDALVECVPNFSEGRDPARMRRILDGLHVPGVLLLDYSADPDHHRMVATIAGPPGAVMEAAVRAVGVAAELIDLRQHRGVHLRMGAADVVPFVPLRGITLQETAVLARQAGAEILRRHGVPVIFYEAAANPHRRLEQARRGQFEGAMADGRKPDLGDTLHPSAGACLVGARNFLVAWNVLLDTADLAVAKAIAREVRESSGGFPGVKAMGVPVRGRAQVTVNITNVEQTPIERVYQKVKSLAAQRRVKMLQADLIGLVPRAAFHPADEWFHSVPGFIPQHRIVEERLAHPMAWPDAA